ncbi:MAG: fibronectin type III domain-containing protein [Propionibacteriaceae bacterium]|nr:fibronectin type III domain-containing protein [Propionibacteriaceae bacterium]
MLALPDTAVLRGTVPAVVDLLANDHDPAGGVLTVTAVTPREPDRVRATVLQGRWLWVAATSVVTDSVATLVDYVVTSGTGAQARGVVTVTQVPPVAVDRVSVVDDQAVVRAGDVTSIAVLANDASASGAALVINDNVPGLRHAGELPVVDLAATAGTTGSTADVGRAYVDGDLVRYEAPAVVDAPRRLRIEYQAGVPAGSPLTGYVWVDVIPAPGKSQLDRAPTPGGIEARALVGSTAVITVPTYGEDPDGDSVTVKGLVTPPQYGRVTEVRANAFVYESYPGVASPGTDSFEFAVTDRYGATGTATIRIGLVPPGEVPLPVAVSDVITAQPGVPVTIHPLTNDIVAVGAPAPVLALEGEPTDVTATVDAEGQPTNQVVTSTPAGDTGQARVFGYHLVAGGEPGPAAQVTVRQQAGYLNPPNVFDHVAASVTDGVATAAVLADAWDVDGGADELRVVAAGAGAVVDCAPGADGTFDPAACTVSVPVQDLAQVVPYVAEDADGARALAVVYVPGRADSRLALSAAGVIALDAGATLTVDLNDYITSPRAGAVYLRLADEVWTTPAASLTATPQSDRAIQLTAAAGYAGPAALTVGVRDSRDGTDPAGLEGVLTIPVEIGRPVPVLYCPDDVQEVVQGGAARTLDILGLCHVWRPAGTSADDLVFTGTWGAGGDNFAAVTPGQTLDVRAASTARAGAESVLTVSIEGSAAVPDTLRVRVVAAPPPTVFAASVTDVRQGTTVAVPLQVASPLADPVWTIVGVTQVAGPAAAVTTDGLTVRVTPGADTHGGATFQVTVADVAGPARTDRQVTTGFSVTVYGRPDTPGAPGPGQQLRSRSAVVTYQPAQDNGAPITGYTLRFDGGTFDCGPATTCEVPGLANGAAYRFQVRATNKAGDSDWSEPGPAVVPDALPGKTAGLTCAGAGDHQVDLAWGETAGEGSAPTALHLAWPGALPVSLAGDQRSFHATGLDNDVATVFTLVAQNAAGLGQQPVTVTCQSAGAPVWTGQPTVAARDLGDTAAVTLAWPAVDANGPGPVTYVVTRTDDAGGTTIFPPTAATTLGDAGETLVYDGREFTYSVVATNGAGLSATQAAPPWRAVGPPAPWSSVGGAAAVTVAATGLSGQVAVTVGRFPDFRDVSGEVVVTIDGQERARLTPGAPSQVLAGFTDGTSVTATFTARSASGQTNAPQAAGLAGGSFGPLVAPVLAAAPGTADQVCATVSAQGQGRDATLVVTAGAVGEVFRQAGVGALGSTACVNAGWDTLVTFTATLTSAATTPARADPPAQTAAARSAVGTPEPWAPGEVAARATGVNGQVELTVPFPAANGGTLVITYTWSDVGGRTGGGTVTGQTQLVDGLTNGSPVTFTVAAGNGTNRNTPVTTTATPYGPLGAPVVTASPDGNTYGGRGVCATATTPATGTNGAAAALAITDDAGGPGYQSAYQTGVITPPPYCVDAGDYKRNVTFTARLVTQTGLDRSDSATAAATAMSLFGPPDPFAAGDVTVTATGRDGEAALTVNRWVALHGGTAYLEITVPGAGARQLAYPGTSATLTGLTNGTPTTVAVRVCTTDLGVTACNATYAWTPDVTVTTAGPPSVTLVSVGPRSGSPHTDTGVCATFSVNPGGAPVTVAVSWGFGSPGGAGSGAGVDRSSCAGTCRTTQTVTVATELTPVCADPGSHQTRTFFTANVTDASDLGRAPTSASGSAGSAAKPVDPTVSFAATSAEATVTPNTNKRVCTGVTANGGGAAARLTVTASVNGGAATQLATVDGTNVIDPGRLCIDAGGPGRPVVFQATVTDQAGQGRADQTATSPAVVSPPDPTAVMELVLDSQSPLGNDAVGPDKQVCVTYTGYGNGVEATLTVTADHRVTLTDTSASGAGRLPPITACADPGAGNVPVTFTATMTDDSGQGRADVTATITLESAADAPPLTVSFTGTSPPAGTQSADKTVCVTASANGHGYDGALTVTADRGTATPQAGATTSGAGGFGGTWCANPGTANTTVTFTATVTEGSPQRRAAVSDSRSVTTPADVPPPPDPTATPS